MATYVLPQVQVFQQFTVSPTAAANPLRAHVSGPHAKLIRFAEADERADGLLGYYDRLAATPYAWPNRPAGGIADAGYVKLWAKNALLKYYADGIASGSVITKTAGYNNRIRSATVNFAANGDTYPRNAALYDRDVAPGDIVKVRGVNGSAESVTLWTYVKDVIGDETAAVVGATEDDADNAATQGASSSVTQTAGPENCVTVSVDASAYDGLASGYVTETYRVLVTEGSVNGDYTTATLRVISGSGEDDVAAVTPSAAGSPTAIGNRGLTLTFNEADTVACSASAASDDVSADDLIAGQEYTVTLAQAFTAPVATSGGDYTGTRDTTYVIEVTRGGTADDSVLPQIKVTTTNGVDLSGPTTVTAAATPVAVGTFDTEIEFDSTQLRKGDRYYVTVTASAEGAMRTIELGHNLDTEIAAGSQVDLTLYILKPSLEITKNRTGAAPLTNFDVDDTEITVNDGIEAYDASWTDGGVEMAMEVHSEESKGYGALYVEVRYWLADLCSEVNALADVADIDAISGPLHPDNPLKWGVFKALSNSNGTEVKYTAVCDPEDDDSWAGVLALLVGRDDVYHLVPLTRRRTALDLYAAHVTAQSGPEQALWRVLWVNLEGLPEVPVVSAGSTVPGHTTATTSDGEVALAVIEDDPDTSGTQYTRVRFTGGNVELSRLGVRAGDVLRCLYTSDGFGNEEYSEFVVDAVQSEDQLRLLAGPTAAVSVAAKVEIWRTQTATEEAAALAANAGSWGDRRVRATWPDAIESSGTVQEGYFMNCAIAGLCSGVLPHQGLTRLELAGFTNVARTTEKFNKAQLDAMALGGVWVVTQTTVPTAAGVGQVYTRHAVTTGDYDDINQREEMITRNVDSISFRFKDHFAPFIGVTNVTPAVQARIDLEAGNLIRALQSENATADLGGQLVSATIAELRPHLVFKDRYVMKIACEVPYPFNNVDIYLMI